MSFVLGSSRARLVVTKLNEGWGGRKNFSLFWQWHINANERQQNYGRGERWWIFFPFSRSLCSVVLSGPNTLCVMWLRVRKDDSACEWRESSNGQKKKMRMKKRNYANYFGKYITQYTPCRWGWEHKMKRWQRERMRTREWGTLIYRFFIMWELHSFLTFHLFFPSSLYFTFN